MKQSEEEKRKETFLANLQDAWFASSKIWLTTSVVENGGYG